MALSQEAIQALDAPVKSFRIFALEQILKEGATQEILDLLCLKQAEETDEECQLFFSHAIATVRHRLSAPEASAPAFSTEEDFQQRFLQANPSGRLDMLKSLAPAEVKLLAGRSAQWVAPEINPAVQSAIVRLFGPFWSPETLVSLKSLLLSPLLSVRLAALEIFATKHPNLLAQDLPKLLSSPDPRIRGLAIQGLARIELDTAVEHIEAMLGGKNPQEKLCGLQNCFFLPFEKIKSILLKFLASETNPSLLQKAGFLLEINGDREVPFRLLEIISRSTPKRAEFLKRIFQGALKAIENSDLMGKDFPLFLQYLQRYEKKIEATRAVHGLLAKLATLETDAEIAEEISQFGDLDRPDLKKALEESLQWNLSTRLRNVVLDLLRKPSTGAGGPSPADGAAPAPPPPSISIQGLALEEAVRRMASWRPADKDLARPILKQMLADRDTPAELRCAALRVARKMDLGEFISYAEPYLKHAQEKLSVAALEYVAQVDPDRVFPLLGYFLQSSGLLSKSAALSLLKRFDASQALSVLSTMFASRNAPQFKIAISCLVHFDFPLVRQVLFDFLLKNTDIELLNQGLWLFQTNPDTENLYPLYKLEKALDAPLGEKVRVARRQNEAALLEMKLLTPDQIKDQDRGFGERLRQERLKEQSAPAPCSLREVRRLAALAEEEEQARRGLFRNVYDNLLATLEPQVGHAWAHRIIMAGGGFLVMWTVFWNWEPSSSQPVKGHAGPILSIPMTVSGKIVQRAKEGGGLLLCAENGKQYILLPDGKGFAGFSPGDRVKSTFVPFRNNAEGVIVAQNQDIEKENNANSGSSQGIENK